MINFGPGEDIDLAIAGKNLGRRYLPELLKQNDRARGLWRRLYEDDEPGVLLADEVGKGKTYVALALAFAVLATQRKGHVLILTHSAHMAGVWKDRWKDLAECVSNDWKKQWDEDGWTARQYRSIDDLKSAASNENLPQIAFASYETLKKYGSKERDAGYLFASLRRARLVGLRLSVQEKNALTKELVECDLRSIRHKTIPKISDSDARIILQQLDRDNRCWKDGAYCAIEDVLNRIQARLALDRRICFDLLIVDEAHKLEGTARHNVISRLLDKHFKKCLLVTATPFALSVKQFQRRLLDFVHVKGAPKDFEDTINKLKLSLDDFCNAVAKREESPIREELERKLRRYMVRDTWDHDRERTLEHWAGDASPTTILPTLLLERLIDGVLQSGQRTHIASRRESLCSSWPAAQLSLEKSPLQGADQSWSRAFHAVVAGRAELNDPKLRVAVDKLVVLLQQGTKVVVFTQRHETAKALVRMLEEHPSVQEKARGIKNQVARFRRHVDKIAGWLNLDKNYAAGVVKVMAHSKDFPEIDRASVRKWWRCHRQRLGDGDNEKWAKDLQPILGSKRHLPLVVHNIADTDSGMTLDQQKVKSRNHNGKKESSRNVDKFNLPSSPLVLIATQKAQEGIDLHHYCRHVVLFDLNWNPAVMEQRIGRVHRLGGIRRKGEKVKVIYCFQKGTYEEVIADRVQQRCVMMRVLLGAGQWLDEDREVKELDQYLMSFPADA
jgi:superfamily II DNA or RNA helicase